MKKEIAVGAIVIVVIVAIMIQTSTKDNKEVREISYNRINIEQQDTNESEEMEESGVENTDNQSNTEENNGEDYGGVTEGNGEVKDYDPAESAQEYIDDYYLPDEMIEDDRGPVELLQEEYLAKKDDESLSKMEREKTYSLDSEQVEDRLGVGKSIKIQAVINRINELADYWNFKEFKLLSEPDEESIRDTEKLVLNYDIQLDTDFYTISYSKEYGFAQSLHDDSGEMYSEYYDDTEEDEEMYD